MKLAVSLCSLTLAVITIAQAQWLPQGFPNPRIEVDRCGRRNQRSYVCDPDGVLEYHEANQLDVVIDKVIQETPCPCNKYSCGNSAKGYKIAVALVSAMNYTKGSSGDEAMDISERTDAASKFAYELFRTWNLGNCDEDVVIFFSYKDNALFTFAGREAGKKLYPARIGSIAMDRRGLFGHRDLLFRGLKSIIMDYNDEALALQEVREAAEKFVGTLEKDWKIGECKENVIIFYSFEDRMLFVKAGEVANKILPKTLIGDIVMDHKRLFYQKKNIPLGLIALTNDFKSVFQGVYKKKTNFGEPDTGEVKSSSSHPTSFTSLFVAAVLLCVTIFRVQV